MNIHKANIGARFFCVAAFLAATGLTLTAADEATRRLIDQKVTAMENRLVETRRDFHRHPELSNREERTSRLVAERLRALGLEVQTGIGRHGVVAVLKGDKPGPVVAVRADMDALPIEEVHDVPYKSLHKGVMHACGHDLHTTVELGVAEILSSMKGQIPGTVKFIFQPAEEGAPLGEEGGALLMIKEGALENPHPSAIFGLHTMPTLEVGDVGVISGGAMASSDHFVIEILGKKAHGAYPQDSVDAVVVASNVVTAFQNIVSRMNDPREPTVLSVGIFDGGNRFNIIADHVRLEGTVRALNETTRRKVQAAMDNILKGITTAFGARYKLQYLEGAPVTFNDPDLTAKTIPSIQEAVGKEHVVAPKPTMGAEDFAYFGQKISAVYYFLGVGNKARGITAQWHTPEFDIDERSLGIGVRVMTNVLLDYLQRESKRTP